jgi:hypothetical protein
VFEPISKKKKTKAAAKPRSVKPQGSLEGNRRKTIGKPNSNPNSIHSAIQGKDDWDDDDGDSSNIIGEEDSKERRGT